MSFEPPKAFLEFRIVRPLGSGAMGDVFLADDELLGRQVAIKFVRQADRPEMRARFLLEARALARLQHPNVVTVHRVGEVLGRPFLVAEWVKGKSLDQLPLPLAGETVLQVAVQLARALAAVHRVGVLHRDLKPANVLLAESGEVKLVDFGVSAELEVSSSPRGTHAANVSPTPPGAQPSASPGPAPSTGPFTPSLRSSPSLADTQPIERQQSSPAQVARLQIGTPLYAAPELLAGAQGSPQSDLYGWGAVLYELSTGQPPHVASSIDELKQKADAGNFAPLASAPVPLAQLVHRCLSPRPQDRPSRAETLLEVLEPLLLAGAKLPDEPYRGLSVFGPEHAALFFGREREARAVLERMRASSFVLVAGDSGVGKSSLCRAGVVPQLEASALEPGRRTRVVEASLGALPVQTLGALIAPWLGVDERAAAAALRSEPEELAVRVRTVPPGEGRTLFVDGLEELISLASADDGECIARFLGALAVRSPGFHCLATARSDFLTRLSALPSLGPEIGNALYLLRPLTEEGLRQAIEGPARASGFRFVPDSLVDDLVGAARLGPGALPLVQFALAELWRKRDRDAKVISGEALTAIGGVGGALARHADEVIAALPGSQRRAAEQLLRRLVSAQGTRTRRTRQDLPPGDDTTRALAALTAARLLITREPPEGHGERGSRSGSAPEPEPTFELAHEALIQSWDQLRAWVGRDVEKRALAQRVERAAEEWERLGAEGLWSRRALRDVDALPDLPIGERERRFLAASRRGVRRRRLVQGVAAVAVPGLVALVLLGARWRAQAKSREQSAAQLRTAKASIAAARVLDTEESSLLRDAWAQFDAGAPGAETTWSRVRALRARLEDELVTARGSVDAALLLGAGDEARSLLADAIVLRLARERGNPLSRERKSLLAQLAPLDPDGTRRAPFDQPARVKVASLPPGAHALLRALPDTGLPPLPLQPGGESSVSPGSYVLEVSTGARLPILLRYGERREIAIGPASLPPGYIDVPAGRYLTGLDGDEDVRIGFFGAPPLHEREVPAFAIGRTEVTFADYLEYLRALPDGERARRLPRAEMYRNGLVLEQRRDGRFLLRIKPTTSEYQAVEGEPLVYPGRHRNASVDWRRLPVAGISFEEAKAYAAWLDGTRRVRGARLCREEEWERAARGADGRSFPGGDSLSGDDANIDETYGREPLAFGPDPAGSHPRSNSPVGAVDMAGNVWELTISRAGTPIIRGGSWYQGALTARSVNREPYEPTARALLIGVRFCTSER